MPQNAQFDSGELRSLAIGYDKLSTPLSPDVRLVDGSNMMVTNKGALNKRPGTKLLDNTTAFTSATTFIDHCIGYETLPINGVTRKYIFASVFHPGSPNLYQVAYAEFGFDKQFVSSLLLSEFSATPHEFAVSRGLLFIRGSNATSVSGVSQGTTIFDGNTGNITPWGYSGPLIPAAVSASGVTSTFTFSVNSSWQYTYTWKTVTGQETNRAPLQTNQSLTGSGTGPLSSNLCPQIVVQGTSDTASVPNICIYRTTDGGGNFYFLDQIPNTGSGNITYVDRHFNDGTATPSQPFPDATLDTTKISPTLVSNSPPPTCTARDTAIATLLGNITSSATSLIFASTFNGVATIMGSIPLSFSITIDNEEILVTAIAGTTATITRAINGSTAVAHLSTAPIRWTPITGYDSISQSTPIATYAGRLWYGIDNILFYSGQEEISTGIPEECWPAGLNGNFYRFNYPIVNVTATSEALYIICTEEIHWIRGYTKDSFQEEKIFSDIGGISGNPRACCTADKSIVFLTNDLRICIARGYKRDFLSDQLATELLDAYNAGFALHMTRYLYQEKDLLIVLAVDTASPGSKQWVYDFNQSDSGLWNIPWTAPLTCLTSAWSKTSTSTYRNNLIGGSVSSSRCGFCYFDFTFATMTDYFPPTTNTPYACSFTVSLVRNPTGNHVNMLREPGMTSILHAVKLDRTAFAADTDPALTYFLDNSTGASGTVAGTPAEPPRRIPSVGYTTLWYMIDNNCERVSAKFSKTASTERLEIQMIAFIFSPDSGA